jgi:hypothetical protein
MVPGRVVLRIRAIGAANREILDMATTYHLNAVPLAAAFVFGILAPMAGAQVASKKIISEAETLNTLHTIKEADLLKTSEPVTIDGTKLFDGWFIVTDKLIFKSGAKLIFSRQAQDARRIFFIVAKEIVSEDASSPGLISYEQPPVAAAGVTGGQAPAAMTVLLVRKGIEATTVRQVRLGTPLHRSQ